MKKKKSERTSEPDSLMQQAEIPYHQELLNVMLMTAVPLWVRSFEHVPWKERRRIMLELGEQISGPGGEYVMVPGPNEGDTARAFNNLAKAIALTAFVTGGITFLNVNYDASRILGYNVWARDSNKQQRITQADYRSLSGVLFSRLREARKGA